MCEDKVVLITGASRGIGRQIALAVGNPGYQIAVHYNSQKDAALEVLQEIREKGGNGIVVQADLSKDTDRVNLLDDVRRKYGRIDVLVNNAGMAPRQRADLLQVGESSYDEVMDVNLKGPFFLTQMVARWMIELTQKLAKYSPVIINIGSISAYTSSTNRAEYCISKAGMGMMTALFADRLAEFGIKVFELRPGIIDTDMTAAVKTKYDGLIANGLTPIKRWGTPDDVARCVVAILQNQLPFSTGEVINIDGGFHLRRL